MTARAATHYTAADIFEATGVPPEKQCQDIERGVIVASRNDRRPNGSGDKRLSSIETVYQFGITAALSKLYVSGRQAAYAARKFTDNSNPGRPAGRLFPEARTLLCIRPMGPIVVNAPYDADFSDLSDHGTVFVALDIGKVCGAIDTALEQINLKKGTT